MVGFQSQLGRLFRDARKAEGLTQAELAEQAHIGLSAVQAVEKGRGRISSLNSVLNALGLELRGRQLIAGPVGPAMVLARKRRKVSRRKLAKALGVSRNTLVAVETGGGLVGTLEAYAGAVGAGLYLARPDAPRGFLTHAGNSTGNNLWETPVWLAKALSETVGGFDLDPCAATSDRRRARVKAKILLTEVDDGLSARWKGRCFVNPPYGRGVADWVRKCFDEGRRGCVVVALIPARPDSNYWHDFVAGHADVFMLRGRLKFGDGENSAPFPSCVVVWGADRGLITRLSLALPDAWHVPRQKPILAQHSAPLSVTA
ncbi:DNA N-6-adenine-methyltransferase [Bradyrhizobium sp. AZCC 2289]|uniref:DNA N-6-adenine-methyltransferase n=1 Tax=Bradyrhizobium sp. AZCC 2289 TaxID=3117026 RepID=UPI002FF41BAE